MRPFALVAEPHRAGIVGGVVFLLFARIASASPPACFPERTVMVAAEVRDARGRGVAGVRAGQQVRVLDDFVGADFDQALIEIDQPLPIQGYVHRVLLHAFPKRPIEVDKNARWWLTGVPLNLHEGDGKRARATRAELHSPGVPVEGLTRFPSQVIACGDLRGTGPKITRRSACYGAMSASPDQPTGRAMRWRDHEPNVREIGDPGESADTPRMFTFVSGSSDHDFYLLSRSGKRALVDEWDWSGERTRHWVDARMLRPGSPRALRTFTSECKCCPAEVEVPVTGETPRLQVGADAPVRAFLDGPTVGVLPAGRPLALLGRLGSDALVRVENTTDPKAVSTSRFVGWIDWRALRSPPKTPLGYPGELAGPLTGPLMDPAEIRLGVTVGFSGNFIVEGRMTSATEFLLPWLSGRGGYDRPIPFIETVDGFPLCSPISEGSFYRLENTDGRLSCGTKARASHFVRVTTHDGLGIPNATIVGLFGPLDEWANPRPRVLRMAADGQLRIPRAKPQGSAFTVGANGFERVDVDPKQGLGQVIERSLKRKRVLAGAVSRNKQGQCSVAFVRNGFGDFAPGSDVSPACRFSFIAADDRDEIYAGYNSEVPLKIGRGDQLNLCVGPSCDEPPPRAWLFVRVANDDDHLVAIARVRATLDGREVGSCLAPSGACFLHDLPAGQEILIEAVTPEGNGQAALTPKSGVVTELTVPL